MSIGNNIKKFREMSGLTQDELGIKMGVSGKTISSWEINRTEPKIGMIEKLSAYFGCEKTDLLDDTTNLYYINSDVREIAQELFDNKDLKMLFDAGRNAKKEDLQLVYDMLNRLKDKEN